MEKLTRSSNDEEALPERQLRQRVLSLPEAQRFLLATNAEALTLVMGVVCRTISRHFLPKAGLTRSSGATGAVTLVQRFGSALNLNVHFHTYTHECELSM